MRRKSSVLVIIASIAAFSPAQIARGDWIISNVLDGQPGVVAYSPTTSQFTTLMPGGPGFYAGTVTMDRDNVHLLVPDLQDYRLSCIDVAGNSVDGAAFTTLTRQLALDQDGTFLCAEEYGLFRIDPATQNETVVWTGSLHRVMGVCVDLRTGDYIIASQFAFIDGQLIRINRFDGTWSVVADHLGAVNGVDYDVATGGYLVTNGGATSALLRVFRNGSIEDLGAAAPAYASAVRSDPWTGRILVAGPNDLRLLSASGALISSVYAPDLDLVSGLEFYGSRGISGSGPATGGSDYVLNFSFPGSAGLYYNAALSDSMDGGLVLADGTNRTIRLALNDLTWTTFGGIPGLLDGFFGTLDAFGAGTGYVRLPVGMPAGFRVFLTVLAVDPTGPSGLISANTWSFVTN